MADMNKLGQLLGIGAAGGFAGGLAAELRRQVEAQSGHQAMKFTG